LLSIAGTLFIIYHLFYFFIFISAGIGRTGTFIAIYNTIKSLNIIKEINKEIGISQFSGINGFYSVFNTVRKLREQRYTMVNDKEQYRYIYEYVWNWINRNLE
jgi:protein tyrosine phosphatase